MIEAPEERGNIAKFSKQLGINPRTAERWWKSYQTSGEVPCKKTANNGPKSSITADHEEYIERLIDQDPQIFAEDIIDDLTTKFEGFSISVSRLNRYLKNNMHISVKRPTFEAEKRNSIENLNTRYQWFMEWKDSNLDYTKNCVFIDEAGFNINTRNSWARSARGIPAIVQVPKSRSPSHTIIGAIHASSVLHVVLKKPPPKSDRSSQNKKIKKTNNGKKRAASEIGKEDTNVEEDEETVDTAKPASKDAMDLDQSLKGSYIVMDNASIHKSAPMKRKIESRGYHVMYLPPYSPELNPIEQFWAIVKGKLKGHRLMTEENLSSRIADAFADNLLLFYFISMSSNFYYEDGQEKIADEQGNEAKDYEKEFYPYNISSLMTVKLWKAAASGRKAQVEVCTAQKWAKHLKEEPIWNIYEKQTNVAITTSRRA
ncbi:hypothetical protein RO3G_04500 [Rhizopus delemar RA 99-880]|uniref:Tc1-like transposase DDE domain-containing protein n=1 Tax=Rhizopus delemar (strain RA 99-880 / ATCC MYA-4621 / FGSC 9543 / NRRL 43880) TaxID=246409 RepID=I1BUB5_RHIO9|nr:hypothetical protein RO3G_04500 [Rhizopus delemar RA 99-880]|eukprot:EIE79795.1 hypothetical protein RO3G_04500 [Rhizopus delemar RA 99-880]